MFRLSQPQHYKTSMCRLSNTYRNRTKRGPQKKKKREASTAPITIHKNSQPDHVYVTYKESQMCAAADSSNQLPSLSLTLWARTQGTIRLMPFILQIWEQRKGHGMKHDACIWHQYHYTQLHSTALGYYAQLPSFTGWYSKSWFSSPACTTSACIQVRGMSAQNKPRAATYHEHLLVAYCCWTHALLL
jgi:hypothetical protein